MTFGKHWGGKRGFPLRIIEVRYSVRPPFSLAPKKGAWPFWALDYDFSGGMKYRLGGKRNWKTRLVNSAHLYPPNTMYWEKADPKSAFMDSGWIVFEGEFDSELRAFTDKHGYAVFKDPGSIIGSLIKQAARFGNQGEELGYWPVVSVLAEIIGKLQKATHEGDEFWHVGRKPTSRKEDLINEAELFISQNLSRNMTVEDIAGHLKISKSTLGHYYRDLTGKTPIQALLEARIAEAKSLLIQGLRLKGIAERTGFCDEYHLAKTFKNITGTTPGKFRSAILGQSDRNT